MANAAASTAIDSHLPRLFASEAVEDSEPVTDLARSAAVVTVAEVSAALIAGGDRVDLGRAGGLHVDRRDVPGLLGQGLRDLRAG